MADFNFTCAVCKKEMPSSETYEYRGQFACSDHFDEMCDSRDHQRAEIIAEENAKLAPLKGLDIRPDTAIGRANRQLLSAQIEIAGKESERLRNYEHPALPQAEEG